MQSLDSLFILPPHMQRCEILNQEKEDVSAEVDKLRADLFTQKRKANDTDKLIQRLSGMEEHMQEAKQRFVDCHM